jgi:hypothetical protein
MTMSWTPQRLVWIFIGISVLTVLACLVLMIRRPRRRREPRTVQPEVDRPLVPSIGSPWPWSGSTGVADADGAPPGSDRTRAAAADGDASAGAATGRAIAGRAVALVAAVLAALFVAVDVPTAWGFPLLGLAVGAAVYLALRSRRGRSWCGLAAAGCLLGAGAYTVLLQYKDRFPSDFTWALRFDRVDILGLLAIFLLGVEAVRDLVDRRAPAAPATPAGPDPAGPAVPGSGRSDDRPEDRPDAPDDALREDEPHATS